MPTYTSAETGITYAVTSASASTNVTVTWGAWNEAYGNATQTLSGRLGASAAAGYGNQQAQGNAYAQGYGNGNQQYAESQELREVARERDRQAAERAAEAGKRAEALLVEHLDAAQATEFRAKRRFIVHSRDGVRRYRVDYGRAGNVMLHGEGDRVVAKFCIHPEAACPNEDVMLAQKLMLETDEKEFLRIANRTPIAA